MAQKKTFEDIGPPDEKRLSGTSRGIIINNTFKDEEGSELLGYEHDEENIVSTFQDLNVEFEIKKNLKANKMKSSIKDWIKETFDKYSDDIEASFCFILTHGGDGGLLYGEDNNTVTMEEIKSLFINWKHLVGKPKLFFVQACRGEKDSEAVDVSGVHKAAAEMKAKDADVFQFFPTAPGNVSWVDEETGSMFIKTVCDVVQAYGGKYHLQDMVTKVNAILSTDISTIREDSGLSTVCEASETTHSLTYNLFFNETKM